MRALGDLQLDPLVAVARAHDLMLHSRVDDYAIDDWATLTYGRREFFEWGGWLAVRPMDELPWYRVLMRREQRNGGWSEIEAEHRDAIDEMRRILATGREVSNRDFAMQDRRRVDDYRGRKDSAVVLHYLWRIGEAMVTRRERFERVYAATGSVAPPSALIDVDEAQADDRLLHKTVAADGLTRMVGSTTCSSVASLRPNSRRGGRQVSLTGPWSRFASKAGGHPTWRSGKMFPCSRNSTRDICRRHGRRTGRRPTRRSSSCRRSTPSVHAAGRSRCSASTTRGTSKSPPISDHSGTTRCRSCGVISSLDEFDPKLSARPDPRHQRPVAGGWPSLATPGSPRRCASVWDVSPASSKQGGSTSRASPRLRSERPSVEPRARDPGHDRASRDQLRPSAWWPRRSSGRCGTRSLLETQR